MIAKLKILLLSIKLRYYAFLEFLDDQNEIIRLPDSVIERKHENVKLARGVKRLVQRLRAMSPSERINTENLLCKEPYKKTAQEIREELKVRHKVMKNPLITTEDDLVNYVVKKAPIYVKEAEVSELRKSITACLKLARENPDDSTYSDEARRLKAKLSLLKREIERMKE